MLELILLTFSVYVGGSSASLCSEGSLQLDNITSPPLVMICSQGQWGYICARDSANSPWTLENLGVICQQLGLIREGMLSESVVALFK